MKYYLYVAIMFIIINADAQLNLQWEQMAPTHTGGMVQSLLLDKRDPSRQTIYAGVYGSGVTKSIDGGNTWTKLNCDLNTAILCMSQESNGDILIGTGALSNYQYGSSYDMSFLGNGIYKVTTGDSIYHLASTNVDSVNSKWMSVRDIVINPVNPNDILVALYSGMYRSLDGGSTWTLVNLPPGTGGSAVDIDWSNNGLVIFAAVGGNNKLVKSVDGGQTWSRISNINNPGFPPTVGRIAVAISPSNPAFVFASMATSSGGSYGLYKSADTGTTWNIIAVKDSFFDPAGPAWEQWFSSALGVSPFNTEKVFVGSVKMYAHSPQLGLQKIPVFNGPYIDTSSLINMFQYVFDDIDSNIAYIASYRGIYKCTNINTGANFNYIHNPYTLGESHYVSASKNGRIITGNSEKGVFSFLGNQLQRHAIRGGFAELSSLHPDAIFYDARFGRISFSLNNSLSEEFLDDLNIDPNGQGDPSRCGGQMGQNAPYFSTLYLYETKDAWITSDSVSYTSINGNNAGDSVPVLSNVNNTPFKALLNQNLSPGQTIRFPDPVKSRLFLSTNCGLWMKANALGTVSKHNWFRLSQSNVGNVRAVTTSNNGDKVWFVAYDGTLVTLEGINSTNFSDSLDWNKEDNLITFSYICDTGNIKIEGIAVSKYETTIILPLAGYRQSGNLLITKNGGISWQRASAGPNNNPAYTCMINKHNEDQILVGTEHGIYSSSDVGDTWVPENDTFCAAPVTRIRQLQFGDESCTAIYAATNGQGIWRSKTLTVSGCDLSVSINEDEKQFESDFVIFPNPSSNDLNISYHTDNSEKTTISIVDMNRRKLVCNTTVCTIGSNEKTLDVSRLESGLYFIEIENAACKKVKKFIILH
jgi:photosystem II stability/assembly factor-like uncharacterized protein